MSPEIMLPDVTEDEYEKAGSKFIVMLPGETEAFLDIEIGMLDWDTPGTSMKVPVTVVEEGPNQGKTDKLSFGVRSEGIWKGKEIYRAITGTDPPMKQGSDSKNHPVIDPMVLVGKPAVGFWQKQKGKKGGDPTAEDVTYPKLVSILAPGNKPKVEDLGF